MNSIDNCDNMDEKSNKILQIVLLQQRLIFTR
jgi:hypothetical protein